MKDKRYTIRRFQVIVVHACCSYQNSIKLYSVTPNSLIFFTDGQIPYDGVPVVVIDTVHIGIIIFFGVLIAGGIIFSVICLIFNFYYRNTMYAITKASYHVYG